MATNEGTAHEVTAVGRAARAVAMMIPCTLLLAAVHPAPPETEPLRRGSPPASISPSPFVVKPARGKFLVATPRMRDPRFAESVILIIEHGEKGTLGLVINHPTTVTLSAALPGIEKREDLSGFLFLGGPMRLQGVTMLLRSETEREEAARVLDDVYFSASADLLKKLMGKAGKGIPLRVFGGHSGWAPGQLDQELKRDDWFVLNAHADDVFHEPVSEIWPELLRRAQAEWVRLPGARPAGLARFSLQAAR